MKLTPANRQELTSATITQALGLTLICSLVFVIAAPASQPAWWSSRGATHAPVVTTNSGIVTTNYVLNDYAAATQGQLKQFTARAVDELNARLTNIDGAGPALTNLVYGWTQDYATNGYNATNLKPSDYSLMTVGQLKYVGSLVYGQLGNAGYTGLTPSWLAVNTNTDNTIALVGQLKQVFNFDLSVPPGTITGLTATASNPGEIDLSWTNPTPNTANSILIQESTDGGVTWTTVDTLSDPTINSYAVTGLSQGASYTFQATTSSTNAGSGSASSSSSSVQAPATPRYAVIDLGTNFFPVAINNSGMIAGNTNTTFSTNLFGPSGAAIWTNGVVTALPIGSFGSGGALAINDSGVVAGCARFNYTWQGDSPVTTNEVHACFWPNATTSPTDLDSAWAAGSIHLIDGPSTTQYSSYGTAISLAGTVYGYYHINGAQDAIQFAAGSSPTPVNPEWDPYYAPGVTPKSPGATLRSAAGTNTCGDYNFDPIPGTTYTNGFIINGNLVPIPFPYTRTNVCYASSINTNSITVGNLGPTPIEIVSGVISNLPGTGSAKAINDYTTTTITTNTPPVTNVTYAPQIVGVDGTGTNGLLWDQTMYDGTPTTNGLYVAKNFDQLLPRDGTNASPWHISSAVDLTDAGGVVANAVYTPTNSADPTPAGVHGIFMPPCQFRLLNGAQTGSDGRDFEGNYPQTLNDSDIKTDNSTTATDVAITGSSKLGPLIDNSGNLLSLLSPYSDCSVFGLLMMAKVSSDTHITYTWNRTYQRRAWEIVKSTDSTQWNVLSTFQKTGFPNPREDTFNMNVLSNTPSSKNILYYYDVPGANFLAFESCKIGDYAYQESHFVYTLTIADGSATTTRSIDVGQRVLAKCNALGNSSSDWTYIYNKVYISDIPNCRIDQDKVRTIVGNDGLKIFITSSANHNDN